MIRSMHLQGKHQLRFNGCNASRPKSSRNSPFREKDTLTSVNKEKVREYIGQIAKEYFSYRNANYPKGLYEPLPFYSSNLPAITSKGKAYDENNIMRVSDQGNFHYRFPGEKAKNIEVKHVLSLNVYPSEKLIEELDKFSLNEKNLFYKTPDKQEDWFKMHDPVTMYFANKPTDEQIADLKKFVSPYIRENEAKKDVLLGEQIANGMAILKYPSIVDVQKIKDDARKLDTLLSKAIEVLEERKGCFSAGAFYLLEKRVNSMQKPLDINA